MEQLKKLLRQQFTPDDKTAPAAASTTPAADPPAVFIQSGVPGAEAYPQLVRASLANGDEAAVLFISHAQRKTRPFLVTLYQHGQGYSLVSEHPSLRAALHAGRRKAQELGKQPGC